MEQLPNTLQSFYAVFGVEEIEPPGSLQLQHMPRFAVGRWEGAVAMGENIQVPSVDAQVEDRDVVVDR